MGRGARRDAGADALAWRSVFFYSYLERVFSCTVSSAKTAPCLDLWQRERSAAHPIAGPGLVIMGVTKDLVKAGDGKTFPKTGDELTMHYTGWLARTETKFDSSVDKGKPFVFKVRAF